MLPAGRRVMPRKEGRAWMCALTTMLLLGGVGSMSAQQQPTDAPSTREDAIAAERADKVAELWPERQSPMVDTVNRLVERGFNEGLESGKGANGPQIVLGGMRSGPGLYSRRRVSPLGFVGRTPGLPRHGTRDVPGRVSLRLQSRLPRVEDRARRRQWYTKYESSPDIDFYGPGQYVARG